MPELTLHPTAPTAAARDRWLQRLAPACVLLMLVVVVSSAWLRLAQERPACSGWPGCRDASTVVTHGKAAAPWMGRADVLNAVRVAHRAAASAMLPAAGALALLALAQQPRRRDPGLRDLLMLGLALGLAALGVVTPGSRSPWVLLGNQLGGLLLLAIAWSTWRGLGAGLPAEGVRWARALALLWLLQAALGALSGAGYRLGPALAHLALAAPAVLGAFALGLSGWYRQRRAQGLALALVATLQLLLGVGAMLAAAMPAWVLLHAGVAALGLALLFNHGLAWRA